MLLYAVFRYVVWDDTDLIQDGMSGKMMCMKLCDILLILSAFCYSELFLLCKIALSKYIV